MGNSVTSTHDLAEVIKSRRKQLQLTQSTLGGRANIYQSVVSKVELGATNIHISTLIRLLDALDLILVIESKDNTNQLELERNIPKRPISDYLGKAICPTCKTMRLQFNSCCSNNDCRQAIDWSEDADN